MAALVYEELVRYRQYRRRRYRYHTTIAPVIRDYSDGEFFNRYRFSRDSVNRLAELLEADLQHPTARSHALTPNEQLMIALRYYATGGYLKEIGDTFGVVKSTVKSCIERVSEALCRKVPTTIKYPQTRAEKNIIKQGFFDFGGFPNCIGSIDCTHIKIIAPHENENNFVNRKGVHSLNIQGVCDHRGKFINVVARWPGSCHDSHIFKNSDLGRYLENNYNGLDDGILIGDSGYGCYPYLMVPYTNVTDRRQERFNRTLKATRVSIEMAFGKLKRRFLLLHGEMQLNPQSCCKVITACFVLHNLAIDFHEPDFGDGDDVDQLDDVPVERWIAPVDEARGNAVREHITQTFFNR